jgi:hypothetical protein
MSTVIATPGSTDEPADSRSFVSSLLECYIQLPHTPNSPSKHDRQLAKRLFERQISLDTLKTAFLLATSRRTFRPPGAPPLEPIRSLAYFLPVVEELLRTPADPIYTQLLADRLNTGLPKLGIPPLDPPIPWCSSLSTTRQRSNNHENETL